MIGAIVLLLGVMYVSVPTPESPLATTEHDPSRPVIEIDGYRFHGEVHGSEDAPVMIVLHGGPGGDYEGLLDILPMAADYRMVFYDQRGSGLSPRVTDGLTIDTMVADLHAMGERFSPERPFYIVGHSWGGMLGAAYLANHEERVEKAVLIDPGFLSHDQFEIFNERTGGMAMPSGLGSLWHIARTVVQSWKVRGPDDDAAMDWMIGTIAFGLDFGEDHPLAGYWKPGKSMSMTRYGARAARAVQSAGFVEGRLVNFIDGIEDNTTPVMIMASGWNTISGADHQERHVDLIPNSFLAVNEDAGHNTFADAPETSMAMIAGFFQTK